jgi:hypothetical protein
MEGSSMPMAPTLHILRYSRYFLQYPQVPPLFQSEVDLLAPCGLLVNHAPTWLDCRMAPGQWNGKARSPKYVHSEFGLGIVTEDKYLAVRIKTRTIGPGPVLPFRNIELNPSHEKIEILTNHFTNKYSRMRTKFNSINADWCRPCRYWFDGKYKSYRIIYLVPQRWFPSLPTLAWLTHNLGSSWKKHEDILPYKAWHHAGPGYWCYPSLIGLAWL